MKGIFDSIATRTLPESVFDLSHEVKLSGNMAELIPVLLEEIIPGDTFQCRSEIMIRLAPMLAPVMHRVKVYTHYFYVPNRLVWTNWHDHITGGEDGTANPEFPKIQIGNGNLTQFGKGSLADYLGIPITETGQSQGELAEISALPFRAYQLIYNEYYRDQDLSSKVEFSTGDGVSTPQDVNALVKLRKRHWERDYLTSARPTPQKGPQVTFPQAEVVYKPQSDIKNTLGAVPADGNMNSVGGKLGIENPASAVRIENIDSLGAITVEDQRRANRLQEWLELAMRGGSRINEIIRNFFGVVPDDLRLTRPEYLGGGMQNVVMSEVLNTAGSADTVTGPNLQPVGEYAGHGISVGNQNGFRQSFKEHGYVIGIMSVIPSTAYQNGLHRHWTKFDKYERYWPQFANIGEQEIKLSEVYWKITQTQAERDKAFGYAPRYSEYKYACSRIAGDFRLEAASNNLGYWHMGRYFENEPTLNEEFVTADPTHRIFAVEDETFDKLYCHVYHNLKAKRKMPYHNIPSNMPVV